MEEGSEFDWDVENCCQALTSLVTKLEAVLGELQAGAEQCRALKQLLELKGGGVVQLEGGAGVRVGDLVDWAEQLITAHSTQLAMDRVVARVVARLPSRQLALFHVSVWAAQPGLDGEHSAALHCLEQTLASCGEAAPSPIKPAPSPVKSPIKKVLA